MDENICGCYFSGKKHPLHSRDIHINWPARQLKNPHTTVLIEVTISDISGWLTLRPRTTSYYYSTGCCLSCAKVKKKKYRVQINSGPLRLACSCPSISVHVHHPDTCVAGKLPTGLRCSIQVSDGTYLVSKLMAQKSTARGAKEPAKPPRRDSLATSTRYCSREVR